MIRAIIALLTALMLQGSAAAQAQRRAIVIGMGEYRELQGIVRPVDDARAVEIHDLSLIPLSLQLFRHRARITVVTTSAKDPLVQGSA